jgi:SAM-dependent methyltransferase
MSSVEQLDRYAIGSHNHNYMETEHCGKVYQELVLDKFIRTVAKNSGTRTAFVCDIACGLGEAGDYIQRQSNFRVIRTDLNFTALSQGIGRRVRSLAEELPFPDSSLNGIHLKDALVHIQDKRNLFDEFSRVLKPHGIVTVVSAAIYFPYIPYLTRQSLETRYKFLTLRDFAATYNQLNSSPEVIEIGPPYFHTDSSTTRYVAGKSGFRLVHKCEWENMGDWVRQPIDRFVLFFQKK